MELEAIHDFLMSKLPPRDDSGEGTSNGADHLQRRRPALGRKRAIFSFKLSQSEHVLHVDPSLDIDCLQDPDEFFMTHERIENAEKELKKSRGDTLDDLIQQHTDTTVRHRRPGILGRKTVSYKHLYPTLGDEENLVPSQEENCSVNIPRSSMGTLDMLYSNSSHPETGQLVESQERELADNGYLTVIQGKGSIAETENRVNELFDQLLCTCKGLDGGEIVSFLQERLQVKTITLDKISLPDLDCVQETLSRPKKPFSDLQQVTKSTANVKTQIKSRHRAERFRCSLTSTPPRSPFASMSILQKRILQKDSLRDPLSISVGADVSSVEQPCSIQCMDKQTLSPPVSINQLVIESLDALSDSIPLKIDGMSSSLDGTMHSSFPAEDNIVSNYVNSGKLPIVDSACRSDRPTDETTNRSDNHMDIMSNGLDSSLQDKVKGMLLDVLVNPVLEQGPEGLITGTVHCSENPPGTNLPMDGRLSGNPSISIEQHNKEHQVPSRLSPKEQTKQKVPQHKRSEKKASPHKRSKREASSLRQSLAGSGTIFESGVRRSTRIKSRPLEYWRGERFLYGRIHDSLPTIIGMKYASPDKGGKESMLKVKSYVREKYAELVEIAALH